MSAISRVFDFNDPVDFLNFSFESKHLKNAKFSMRGWARQLGYKNPSYLSHILKRERKINPKITTKFIENLKLNSEEKKYFEILVLLESSTTVDQKNLYLDILESMRPKHVKTPQPLNADIFRVISDWHHTAILELVELKDFKYDENYISQRLGGEISPQNIRKAISRLLKLELLEIHASGKLKRVKDNPILLESPIPNEAIRHFHKQMIEKGKDSIDSQSIDDRDVRGSTISLKRSDYPKIKKILKKAHAQIAQFSTTGEGDELYQFNTQFFKITKGI